MARLCEIEGNRGDLSHGHTLEELDPEFQAEQQRRKGKGRRSTTYTPYTGSGPRGRGKGGGPPRGGGSGYVRGTRRVFLAGSLHGAGATELVQWLGAVVTREPEDTEICDYEPPTEV